MPDHYYAAPEPAAPQIERIAVADAFFANTKAVIREGGDKAYYSPTLDLVQMPPFAAFVSAEAHASTLAHELVHWTASNSRVGRDLSRYSKDRSERAREELIAELRSVFVCADLGIAPEPRDHHAAYIASWLTCLQNDKRGVFQAASAAEKAVAYLHSLQAENRVTDDGEEAAPASMAA